MTTTLSPQDLAALGRQLDERQSSLQADVEEVRAEMPETPTAIMRQEVDDEGAAGEERIRGAVRQAEVERDVFELRDIEAAKARMDAGEYGDCIDCGVDIPLARLQVQPAAARCIDCQSVYERTHVTGPRISGVL